MNQDTANVVCKHLAGREIVAMRRVCKYFSAIFELPPVHITRSMSGRIVYARVFELEMIRTSETIQLLEFGKIIPARWLGKILEDTNSYVIYPAYVPLFRAVPELMRELNIYVEITNNCRTLHTTPCGDGTHSATIYGVDIVISRDDNYEMVCGGSSMTVYKNPDPTRLCVVDINYCAHFMEVESIIKCKHLIQSISIYIGVMCPIAKYVPEMDIN